MADRSVTVVLIAKITDFERGMAQATASTKKFEAELDKLRATTPRKLDAVGDAAKAAAKKTDGLAASAKVASAQVDAVGDAAKGTAKDVDKLAASAKVAGEQVDDLGDEVGTTTRKTDGLGDETRETGRDMLTLAARIEVAKAALHGLSTEFAGAGDNSLTPKIRAARRELAELERVAKFLTPGDGKRGLVGAAASAAGGGLASLGELGSKLRGAMIPIILGSIVAASPIIGSAIGVAIVGAAGAGGIIGGIVLASKDTRVKAAWSTVGDGLKEEFSNASATFVKPLVSGAKMIDTAFKALKPTIDSVFGDLAKAVEPLARGGAGFLTNLGPGLKSLSAIAGPLMQDLAHELPNIGNALSNMFQSFRQGGPELRAFFKDFLGFVKGAMVGLGNFVEFSAHAYDVLKTGGQVLTHFLATGMQSANLQQNMVTRQLEVMQGVPAMQERIAHGNGLLTESEADLKAKAEAAADAINKQNDAFRNLLDTEMFAINANVAYEQSMDDLKQSVDDNGHSLNIHTQKGRENTKAILSVVDALAAQREAEFEAGGNVDAANAHFQQQIDVLGRHLRALGFSKSAVQALIGKLRAIPPSTTAKVAVTGDKAANAQIQATIGWLNYLNGRTAYGQIIITRSVVGADTADLRRGFASGTPSAPPGWAWTGERGPELVKFRGGEQVATHQQSVAMARYPGYASGVGNSSMGGLTVNVQLGAGNLRKAFITDAKGRNVGEAAIRVAYP